MSQRNEPQPSHRNYELVDADDEAWLLAPDEDFTTSEPGRHNAAEPPTLPLYSVVVEPAALRHSTRFVAPTAAIAMTASVARQVQVPIQTAADPSPTLPSGEVITAKNSLPSSAAAAAPPATAHAEMDLGKPSSSSYFPLHSNANKPSTTAEQNCRNYELVDAGNEEFTVARVEGLVEAHNDEKITLTSVRMDPTTLSSNAVMAASATLPTASAEKTQDRQPTLPTGDMITAKNTLQSFDAFPGRIRGYLEDNPLRPVATTPSTTAVAVAIENDSNIVYAELAPELVPSLNVATIGRDKNSDVTGLPSRTPWYKRRSTFIAFAFVSLLLAVGMGIYAGTTRNKNASVPGVEGSNMFPVNAPVAKIESQSPSAIPSRSPTTRPTATPTATPTTTPTATPTIVTAPISSSDIPVRSELLTSYINSITLSNQVISASDASPESMALAWMITNDTSLNTSELALTNQNAISPNSTIGFYIQQRYALFTMWFQQNESMKWARTDNWLSSSPECTWYGIFCKVKSDTGSGDSLNAVTSIILNGTASFVGIIPSDIGLLTNMQHFEIRDTYDGDTDDDNVMYTTNIKGTLPESIGQWTALTYFDVSNDNSITGAGLTGTLPMSVSQWTSLTHFDISFNILSGTLPDSIGQWTALSFFNIDNNDFSGTLPTSIGQWTRLEYCTISGNTQLIGSLPENIGLWTALTYFDFSFNFGFMGTLPNSIGQWTALKYFNAGATFFTGTLPESIGNWINIISFDFGGTSVPDGNTMRGTLPLSIGQWTALNYLYASHCALNGTLPSSIGNWTSLISFYISNNFLTGTLPDSIGQWTALSYFSVDSNKLNGTIPLSIGNWSFIREAYFFENKFNGSMPDTICPYIDPSVDRLWADCKACDRRCTRRGDSVDGWGVATASTDGAINPSPAFAIRNLGGDLAGLSVAYHLLALSSDQKKALHITICDVAEGPGHGGASAEAGGLLHPLSPRGKLVHCCVAAAVSASEDATSTIRLRDELYRAATAPEQVKVLRQTAALYPQWAEWREPDHTLGALGLFHGCGVLHVPSYLRGFYAACAKQAARTGSSIRWQHVRSLPDENTEQSTTEDEPWNATIYCYGANMFARRETKDATSDFLPGTLTPAVLPVQLVRGQSIQVQLAQPLTHARLGGKYISPVPQHADRALIGATHEFEKEPWSPQQVCQDLKARTIEFAPFCWEDLDALLLDGEDADESPDSFRLIQVTRGYRVQSARGKYGRRPIVGQLPMNSAADGSLAAAPSHSSWIFTGLSSRGLLYHGLYGQLLAQAILQNDERVLLDHCPDILWWKNNATANE